MKFELFVNLQEEQSSLWAGGKYKFTVNVPNSYPHEAPKCHCDTPIYHPNIDLQGNVCLNILRADWKPVLGINTVILGLVFLFIEPNPNDPLNKEAAELMRNNPASFA
jgi:ubiquitin-conjugating enzyme E2 M